MKHFITYMHTNLQGRQDQKERARERLRLLSLQVHEVVKNFLTAED